MDFHAMKRKRLQSLCKKHGIPANLKNKEMADRLSLILKGKENDASCHSSSDNAGTDQGNFQCVSCKDLLNEQTSELNSNSGNNLQMVASDTVAGNVDAREEEKFASSGKRSASPNLEERAGFSHKVLKISEIEGLEPETNLSPEITRDDVEICDVEQGGVNKEQVDDNQEEGLHSTSAPGVVVINDVDLVQDGTEEFRDHLEEAEVENLGDNIDVHDCVSVSGNGNAGDEVAKQDMNEVPKSVDNEREVENLGDKTDAQEEICGTRKGGAECDKQDDTNSLQGSDMKDTNLPRVSPEESGYPLVGGEAKKSDETICVHGDVYSFSFECLESDTVSDQFLTTNPLSEAKSSDLNNIHQFVVSGDAAGNTDVCEAKIVSSSRRSIRPDSEIKGLDFETNMSPEIPKDNIQSFDMEENMQSGLNKDCIQGSQEVFHAAPSELVMNNVDLVRVSSEEFDNHLIERGFEKLVDQNDLNEDVYGTGKGGAEDQRQYETNTPQGSNINDVNQEESGYPLVQGEAQKSDETICAHGGVYSFRNSGFEVDTVCFADTSVSAKDTGWNTDMTVEHFSDEVQPSNFRYSDRVSDLFLTTNTLSEAKSSDLNIHQFVVSGTASGNVDALEARFVSSPKMSSSSLLENVVGPSPSLLNDLENKGLEFETNLPLETQKDDIEMCDVQESMQSDVDKDHVDENQEVLHAAPSAMVMNNVDLVQGSSEVFGNHLMQRELEKLADKTDRSEGVCGTGNGGAEAEKQDDTSSPQGSNTNGVNWEESGFPLVEGEVQKSDDPIEAEKHGETNSPQGSNINDVNPEESGYPLVEGEVLKSDDTSSVHGNVHNNIRNNGSEGDPMGILDSSIYAKDSGEKTNVTADHFPDQVDSSYFEYSDVMPDQFLATFPQSEVQSSDFNMHEMVASDTTEEKLESSQKKGLVADPEECIEFYSMPLETSEIKEFETQTSFDPSTLGDIVGNCNISGSMQSVKTDTVSGDEDTCQEKLGLSPQWTPVAGSEKRNTFSSPKALESSMMKKELENEKNSTLKTARDIVGSCDMKENINTAKKERFGSTMSKKTFPKRQPLQDLQQN